MPRPTIAFITSPATGEPAELDALRAVADVVSVTTAQALRVAAESAEIALVWDFQTEILREAGPGGLRWIHTNSIGVDAVVTAEIARSSVLVTNTRGVYERPMAEYVLALILDFTKGLGHTREKQRTREWSHRPSEPIHGRRALVLGPGAVGREITQMLRAVGMAVDVVGRRERDDEPGIGRVHALDDLAQLLPQAQDVIVALPLTAETHGIVDADLLARMQPGAVLINVGRGSLVDEPALLKSLRSGRLAAALLDVFEVEPLPADHPFWGMENVFVSPHMSGDVHGWQQGVVDLFLENLERWRTGTPLLNVVDKQRFAVADVV